MANTTPINIPKKSQEGIINLYRQCFAMYNTQWNMRDMLRNIDLKYMREIDWTPENVRAYMANRYGDANKFRNVTIPVILPQVENAVTYQASVFLTGTPIFGVVSDPVNEDAANQMEALIGDQQIKFGWVRELMLFLRDGFKYNIAATEVSWEQRVTAALDTDLSYKGGKEAKPKEVIWSGNRIRRWDMYNTFFDTRVIPTEVYRQGEFAGTQEIISRIELKARIARLPSVMIENIVPAFESGQGNFTTGYGWGGLESYYIPQLNPFSLINRNQLATTNWMAWAGLESESNGTKIQYRNMYQWTVLYAKILPGDFGIRVPAPNTPQIWKFIIINNQIVLYAERQTNAHDFIPVLFSQPLEDGLSYQTKSLAQNVEPIQDVTSALMNGVIAGNRRSITDRMLYNPSLITKADINSDNPSAKIPVRPNAYGKSLAEAVYHFPFDNSNSQFALQQINSMGALANQISGQNPARQGQFVKGNKTLTEYSDVMSHSNGRDQLVSMLLEDQIFGPMKEIIKSNNLQYQGGTELYSQSQQKQITVDPVALRKAITAFKVSDGLLPTDKIISDDAWTVAMQTLGSSQQIGSGYDLPSMVAYLLKTKGANVDQFKKSPQQQAYEQALQQWQIQTQEAISVMKDTIKTIAPATLQQWNQLMQEIKQSLPAQPQPQQFGYNPGQSTGSQQPVQPSQQQDQSTQQSPAGQMTQQLQGAT